MLPVIIPIPRRRALLGMASAATLGASGLSLADCAAPLPNLPVSNETPITDGEFVMPDGTRLPYRTWFPDGRPHTVILGLHGFNDSRDAWEIPAPAFQQAGIAIYGPDQRGFGATATRGQWEGVPPMAADVTDMARLVRARHPDARLVVMGESMGGALAMVAATLPAPPPADAYVLLSPAVWGRAQMGIVLSSGLWIVASVAPGWEVTGAEVPVKVRASDNRAALIRLARDPLTLRRTRFGVLRGLTDSMDAAQQAAPRFSAPGLFLYGGKDDLVPPAATDVMWRRLPARMTGGPIRSAATTMPSHPPGEGARRAYYPNGFHLLLRDLDRQAPTGDIIAWLRDPDALLPSAADFAAGTWLATQEG